MSHIESRQPEKTGLNAVPSESRSDGRPLNYYVVLDVQPTATRMEIREAYLRLKTTYAGDGAALYSLISEDEARSQLAVVEEAYRVLYDEMTRRAHDQKLGLLRRPGPIETHPLTPPPSTHGAERLLYARARQSPADHRPFEHEPVSGFGTPPPTEPGIVRTARSTLSVVNLHAKGAGNDGRKAAMLDAINGADPGDGDLLRRLRQVCEVSEEELQERCKVCIGYIRAIESNRFDRLPQAVYVKGFLRGFYQYMAVPDSERLVAAFSQRLVEWQQANRKG